MQVKMGRDVTVPDVTRLARLKKNPELGPRILFFSGGSALRALSRKIINYTYNSIHVITSFDSGGSSAKLREAFQMPAVGDIRARLLDLAEQDLRGNREIFALFAYRFPKNSASSHLFFELDEMISGSHPLIAKIHDPGRKIILNYLKLFREKMTAEFDLRGASVGNLILTAGFLDNRLQLEPVIDMFSKLVRVRGTVLPIANKYLHLAAELEDGSVIVGQHLLTGKEVAPIAAKINRIYITDSPESPHPYTVKLSSNIKKHISGADLICYPMGSFFSSIAAHLLVKDVCRSIAANSAPKIYIPNTGRDPECFGYTLMDQVDTLLEFGRADDPALKPADLINFVVIDRQNGDYAGNIDDSYFTRHGIKLIDYPLISRTSKPFIAEDLLLPLLLSMGGGLLYPGSAG